MRIGDALMITSPARIVLRHIQNLAVAAAADPCRDQDLLQRFITQGDESAFETLLRRYAALVWAVCRGVLRDWHAVEDAFQATFLTLACKAAAINNQESVSCWLHGVAYRVALKARTATLRRQVRQAQTRNRPPDDPAEDLSWRELRAVLDEELRCLPAKHPAPLLLCYLQGRTRDEAAQELGLPLGTLKGRLEHGRRLLRERLTRRGITLSAALCVAGLSSGMAAAAPPVFLLTSTRAAALLIAAGKEAAK
jgi:RNA polymerase sigma factor (sigma-70 family)